MLEGDAQLPPSNPANDPLCLLLTTTRTALRDIMILFPWAAGITFALWMVPYVPMKVLAMFGFVLLPILLLQLVYHAATYITLTTTPKHRGWLQFALVTAAWFLPLVYFLRVRAPLSAILARGSLPWLLGFTVLLSWLTYAWVAQSPPTIPIRACLWVILIVAGISLATRHDVQIGHSSDDDYYEADSGDPPPPTQAPEQALLNYLFFSGGMLLATAVAITRQRD